MKILAIDIGAKTQDILLYDSEKTLENCVKLVLPSTSYVLAEKVMELEEDLFINGDTIGGGMLSRALKAHAGKGFRVVMTESAARTVRDDLDVVRGFGIEIKDKKPKDFSGVELNFNELNIPLFSRFLENFNENLGVEIAAIGVQDHGYNRGISARKNRFNLFRKIIENSNRLESFVLKEGEIPENYFRLNSAALAAKREIPGAGILVMDTSPGGILGCLEDPVVRDGPLMIINVGNGHTIFSIIFRGRIDALMEHHTRLLKDPKKLENLVIRFANGRVTNEEIFNDGGNGSVILKPHEFDNIKQIVVTGPNRKIFEKTDLNYYFASPGGDMMMTGPLGLIRAAKMLYGF